MGRDERVVLLLLLALLLTGATLGCVVDLFRRGDGGANLGVSPVTSAAATVPLGTGG